jgi:potassium-transporting ATPase KdpC subunit
MFKQLWPGFRIALVLTVLTGLIYPAIVTLVCQLFFPRQANGSLMEINGRIVGSGLVGQKFTMSEYFHPRPSSAGADGYDASASSGSNLGPTSAKLIRGATKLNDKKVESVDFDGISLRIVHYCLENGVLYEPSGSLERFKNRDGSLNDVKLIKAFNNDKDRFVFTPKLPIPADAVTGSGSGLDPDISPANAFLQAGRIAKMRGVPVEHIRNMIGQAAEKPALRFLGEPRVNVLKLNLALDQKFRIR